MEQRRRARAVGLGRELRLDVAADHQADDLAAGAGALREGLDVAAVAKDRERVAERVDLVHAVRDEDRGRALVLQVAQEGVDGLDVAGGQRRGGFVEDEDGGVAADRLGDLHHLAARQAEVADEGARVDVLALDAGEERLGAPALGGAVDQPEALRRVGERDVVGDREVGDQRQLLEDADDAGAGGLRAGSRRRPARPARRISPVSGRSTPEMILISVDLPAPFSPRTAWMVPRRQAKSTPSSARMPAKCFETPVSWTWGSSLAMAGSPAAREGRRRMRHMSASDCAMMAGPEMFTPQGGNSLTVKKLSGRSDQKFSPSFRSSCSRDRQRHRDELRHRVAFQRRDRGLHRDGDEARRLADRHALQAFVGVLGDQLAEAVLGLARDGDEGVAGVHHRLHGAGRAALDGDAVELAVDGDGVGRHLLRGAVVPVADDLDDLPVAAGGVEDLVDADRAVAVDRVAGQAADLEDLAAGLAVRLELVDEELRPLAAHLELVLVDLHDGVGVEDVVERHEHDVVLVGEADHPVEALGRDGDGDDRVEALVDEVLDRAELRRRVGAGRDDLELGDLVLDRRVLGIGLGGLDHLDPPGVADEAVDDGDPVRAFLGRPLEVGRLGAPGREAFRVRAGPGDDLGSRERGAAAEQQGRGRGKSMHGLHGLPPRIRARKARFAYGNFAPQLDGDCRCAAGSCQSRPRGWK